MLRAEVGLEVELVYRCKKRVGTGRGVSVKMLVTEPGWRWSWCSEAKDRAWLEVESGYRR